MSKKIKVIVITGPTACGKTRLAVKLARALGGGIVSADSRQVYKHMDIGSGKDIGEYGDILCRLIDIADPAREVYNLARFLPGAYDAIAEFDRLGLVPVVCGGTALYLDALLRDYRLPGGALPPRNSGLPRRRQDPEAEKSFSPPFGLEFLVLGVYYPREAVRSRIAERLDARLNDGLIEEVEKLHSVHGLSFEQLEFFGLEYREAALYLQNRCTREEMRSRLLDKIRQFAKRQDIFFRKMERAGVNIYWLEEPDREKKALELAKIFLSGGELPEVKLKMTEVYYGKRSSGPGGR